MTPLFTKLDLGSHRAILVCNAPASFEPEVAALAGVTVPRDPAAATTVGFAVAFVRTLAEVEGVAAWLPKAVGAAASEGVRQVAIDADWSGIRFRRTEYIKAMTRDASRAVSAAWLGQLLVLRRSPKDYLLLSQWLFWFVCSGPLYWGARTL